jgi:hypothetical protein
VYTANAIESVNYTIQKIIKHRQPFPNDEAAMKLISMGLKNISRKWKILIRIGGSPQSIRDHLWGRQSSPMITVYTKIFTGSFVAESEMAPLVEAGFIRSLLDSSSPSPFLIRTIVCWAMVLYIPRRAVPE